MRRMGSSPEMGFLFVGLLLVLVVVIASIVIATK